MVPVKHVNAVTAALLSAGLLALAPAARADEAVEGPGVQVSPGTVLHPNVGAEAGVINNVFFEESASGPVTSGVLRISAKLDLASAKVEPEETLPDEEPGKEPAAPTFVFRAGLAAAYEEYLYYDNPSTTAQRNLTFDTQAHLQVYPAGTWSFLADDRLRRDVRPRNYEDALSSYSLFISFPPFFSLSFFLFSYSPSLPPFLLLLLFFLRHLEVTQQEHLVTSFSCHQTS